MEGDSIEYGKNVDDFHCWYITERSCQGLGFRFICNSRKQVTGFGG